MSDVWNSFEFRKYFFFFGLVLATVPGAFIDLLFSEKWGWSVRSKIGRSTHICGIRLTWKMVSSFFWPYVPLSIPVYLTGHFLFRPYGPFNDSYWSYWPVCVFTLRPCLHSCQSFNLGILLVSFCFDIMVLSWFLSILLSSTGFPRYLRGLRT